MGYNINIAPPSTKGSTHMKELFEDTVNATVGWVVSMLTIIFSIFFTFDWFEAYYPAKRQWEANWDSLFNPNFETYPFIQDMNYLGIDLYDHAENLKPSIWSTEFAFATLPTTILNVLGYVLIYLIYLAAVEQMRLKHMAKVSP